MRFDIIFIVQNQLHAEQWMNDHKAEFSSIIWHRRIGIFKDGREFMVVTIEQIMQKSLLGYHFKTYQSEIRLSPMQTSALQAMMQR